MQYPDVGLLFLGGMTGGVTCAGFFPEEEHYPTRCLSFCSVPCAELYFGWFLLVGCDNAEVM